MPSMWSPWSGRRRYPRQRPADDDDHDRGCHRRLAPADRVHRCRDCRGDHAAERKAQADERQRPRPAPFEPVDDGRVQREEAAEARAQRDQQHGAVEAEQRLDPAQGEEAQPHHDDAGADQLARAVAVDDPAENRPDQRSLGRLQRGGGRDRCPAPPLLDGQRSEIGTERLVQEPGLEELQPGAGGDHLPAMEHFHRRRRASGVSRSGAKYIGIWATPT